MNGNGGDRQFSGNTNAFQNVGIKGEQNKDNNHDAEKPVEVGREGNSSTYAHNNFFESNMYLQHNASNLYGAGFFATPISPDYNHMRPSTSNINYYNLDYVHEEKTQQNVSQEPKMMNNIITDSRTAERLEASDSGTQGITSSSNYMNLQSSGNPLFVDNIQPKLQNIVSTANLKCELDLREIALRAKNAEYNPKRFAAVIMRIREPKTTALIFASGKMVCTGARSEEDSKKAARQYAKIINKLGFPVKFSEFKIQNIVGSCDVRFPIRLEGLANTHARYCSYEPEMFPGLIYRMIKPKIVLLIFVSGKIVLTGAKERNDIFAAFQNIYETLLQFKKKETGSQSTDMSMNINEG